MGIQPTTAAMLLEARRLGVNYEETLTLGRQSLQCSPIYLKGLFKSFDLWPRGMDESAFEAYLCNEPYWADPLFEMLGANRVTSMDVSDFEGATVTHNLNLPLPVALHEKYDVVFDGGLLEHVFNFPVAMESVMSLVKSGGHLIISTIANNYCGHGFYQFSPELFYRVLSEENGFQIKHISFVEEETFYSSFIKRYYLASLDGRRFAVPDPARVGRRVNLISDRPVMLNIIAQRVRITPLFEQMPQQSDYVALWNEDSEHGTGATSNPPLGFLERHQMPYREKITPSLLIHVRMHLIHRILHMIRPFHYRKLSKNYTFGNTDIYREIDLKKNRR